MTVEENEEKLCQNCKYFKQHYVKVKNSGYMKTYAGHCANPRLREKKPDAPACRRFAKG